MNSDERQLLCRVVLAAQRFEHFVDLPTEFEEDEQVELRKEICKYLLQIEGLCNVLKKDWDSTKATEFCFLAEHVNHLSDKLYYPDKKLI